MWWMVGRVYGCKNIQIAHVLPQSQVAPLTLDFTTGNKAATHGHVVPSNNVNSHICIMQKVGKQLAEGHKLAQHQLSN